MTGIASLLALSAANSIDALAVGLCFELLRVSIALAWLTIAAFAFKVTAFGFALGKNVGGFVCQWTEIAGAETELD